MSDETYKPSAVENAKKASNYLHGTIATVLHDDTKDHFEEDDKQLLKFHGSYQQYDRDVKKQPGVKGPPPKHWMFMLRLNIPGGIITPEQYLTLDDLSDSHANGTIRLTTRQTVQYHGILKGELQPLIKGVHDAMLSSIAACGDVNRNVMAAPAPIKNGAYEAVQRLAVDVTEALKPQTQSYYEIWVDGEKQSPELGDGTAQHNIGPNDVEPFYGDMYLPRKFKIGISLDIDNSVDLRAYDCGLVAVTEETGEETNGVKQRRIVGFNVTAGGGFGMTHNKDTTIARIATPIAFVGPEHGVEACKAVCAVYRDNGNRENRKQARLKYLIEKWGVEKFREEFDKQFKDYTGVSPEDVRDVVPPKQLDYLGRHEQGDGKQFVGVFVQNGRIADTDQCMYRTAFRKIVEELKPSVRITPMQSLIFADLAPGDVDRLYEILEAHNVRTEKQLSNATRYSMACVALPTCGLALTESERALPDIAESIGEEMAKRGLGDVELVVRMTGCPNGCARPYNADIGFVGRKPGRYHMFVGGGIGGDRIADLFAADVPQEHINATLAPLLDKFAAERTEGETLSDFYQKLRGRTKPEDNRVFITGKEEATAELVQLAVEL